MKIPGSSVKKKIKSGVVMAAIAGSLADANVSAANFVEDVSFLRRHTDIVVLSSRGGDAMVAIAPAWQGRVMTSTATGDKGISYGWINRDLIASGRTLLHINPFGGEDRFWMGPEGGQFSIYFAKSVPFDFEHWFTPAPLDTEPFKMTKHTESSATFEHSFALTNYSGAEFKVKVNRQVKLLPPKVAWKALGMREENEVKMVAFESVNQLINAGKNPWTKESGLLSIWILGMFNPAPQTTVVVPIKSGSDSALGKKVTSDYFGEVPGDRLVTTEKTIFLKADGKYRSKIGVSPRRGTGILGSYDAESKVLTLVQHSQPKNTTDYVNSLWKLQEDPFSGDMANSYNDGPVSPGGKPLGPFYELESSSPAAALKKGGKMEHIHRTFHIVGTDAALNRIAMEKLGVGLTEIAGALPK